MKATGDVWKSDRLAAYARAEARLAETASDEEMEAAEREMQEAVFLWKLYAASGSPFGPAASAVAIWREFQEMTTAS